MSGKGGRLGAVANAEFGQNRFDMSAGGLRTDEQRGRDLGVTVSGRYEFEHVTFTLGEPVRVRGRLLPTGVRVAPTELREALASSPHRGACTQRLGAKRDWQGAFAFAIVRM